MKNFIKCLLILFSVLFFNNSSFSQQDKGIIESQNNNNFKNKRWAIVIGISKYKTYSNLQYAHSDAISFYNYLISPIGGSIDTNRAFLLLDSKVQFGEINKILSNLSNKVQKDDEIIFYFSGHGAAENNASIGYLLCYNTEGSNLGFNDCYPISSLRNWCLNYSKLGCKVIVILDACRSGNNNLGDELKNENWENVTKILACQSSKTSKESDDIKAGIFTYHFIPALEGLADENADNRVTILELSRYLVPKISYATTDNQIPDIYPIDDYTISFVNKDILEKRKNNPGTYIENIKITHSRDKNDIKFDNIESSIRKIINDINSDILNKRLVEPENNCAFSKYISIYKNPACKDIKEEIKNDLIGALMDESQKYISTYLNNPNNIDYKSTAIAEKMTYRILQIMDKNDFLYNNILCRYCHLKGINLYKNQPIEAEKYFNESIKLDKYSASNYNILGIILMNSDSFNKAKKFFLYSIYCSPNWSFPYINLGLIYKQEGNYDSALINYNKSIQLNPTCPEPYNNRGKLFLDTKNYQNALSDFNKSIELGLNTPIVYNNRANTFSELKEFDNAIADYSKALELDTSYAYIFFNRAQLYEEQTKYKKAIYDYLEYLKLAKNNLDFIYYHLGICYHRLDDEISAMRCYKKSLSINPDNADANFNIANMYYEKSYYEDAIEYYNKTLNSDSNYTEIYLWRGRSYFYLKNYDKAIIDLNKYVSINPDDFTGHHQRGILYFTIKEYKKAVEDFQYCIKINPQHAYTYTRLGEAYENLNNLKNAEYNYTKSVELSPDDFNALERLGGFYLKTQYYSGSLIMFNKLISLRTKASDYYCRGIAQYNLGKYEEALKDWEETLKIKPDFGKSIEKYIEKSKSLIK